MCVCMCVCVCVCVRVSDFLDSQNSMRDLLVNEEHIPGLLLEASYLLHVSKFILWILTLKDGKNSDACCQGDLQYYENTFIFSNYWMRKINLC